MKYFNLYPSTQIELGYTKACIFDMERSLYCSVPLSMGSFFKKNRSFNLSRIEGRYNSNEMTILSEYINFMVINKLATKSNFKLNFKDIELRKYVSPYLYETLVISSTSFENCMHLLEYLPNPQIFKYIQIRIFEIIHEEDALNKLLIKIKERNYINIEICLNYCKGMCVPKITEIIDNNPETISRLILFNIPNINQKQHGKLIYIKNRLFSDEQCGIVSKKLFMTNMDSVMIASIGNSCLYKKISINSLGDIRHCPAMKKSFGNIKQDSIEDIVRRDDFLFMGNIRKDEIDVCKDCEYRYVCTDCRCFIKDPQNIYSQPSKCTYNPYIAKWEGEDGYIPVEDCGRYTKDLGFVPNKRKISNINKNLCGN